MGIAKPYGFLVIVTCQNVFNKKKVAKWQP